MTKVMMKIGNSYNFHFSEDFIVRHTVKLRNKLNSRLKKLNLSDKCPKFTKESDKHTLKASGSLSATFLPKQKLQN